MTTFSGATIHIHYHPVLFHCCHLLLLLLSLDVVLPLYTFCVGEGQSLSRMHVRIPQCIACVAVYPLSCMAGT